jgi:ribosomal protein L16/L10AE
MEVRMGSGKGAPDDWVAVVKEGLILFEVAGVPEDVAKEEPAADSTTTLSGPKVLGKVDLSTLNQKTKPDKKSKKDK